MLNKVMIIGELGRDPGLRYSQSSSPVTLVPQTESLHGPRRQPCGPCRVAPTSWCLTAEYLRVLTKGSLVFVEGSLQTRKWQDQQGQDRYTTEIKAQRVQFLDKRGGEQGGMPSGAGGSEGGYSAPRRPAAAQQEERHAPSSARSSGRTITKIWARRFLPRPAAWTTCRSREIWGRESGILSPERFPSQAPPLSSPKTFD